MEGLFGIINFESHVAKATLENMAHALGGSLEANFYFDQGFGMGLKRLPIIKDNQFLKVGQNEKGDLSAIIVGEIHNQPSVSSQLRKKGHVFSTESDVELITHLYEEYGDKFITHLDGLFAFAFWSRAKREIVIGLDRYGGIRRLHYVVFPNGFAFASSVRCLLTLPDLQRRVDESALFRFFSTGHIIPSSSIFHDIKRVRPGSIISCTREKINIKTVDQFHFTPTREAEPDELKQCLQNSIKKRLISDKPVGILLSGGLDSSINVAIANSVANQPVKTFSVGFSNKSVDESFYSNMVSQYFNTEHHRLVLEDERHIDKLPDIVWSLEEPIADASLVPTYCMVQFVKNETDVIIAGDGPDHLFGRNYPLLGKKDFFESLPLGRMLKKLVMTRSNAMFSLNRILAFLQQAAHTSFRSIEHAYWDLWTREAWHAGWEQGPDSFMGNLFSPGFLNKMCYDVPRLNLAEQENNFNRLIAYDFLIDGSFGVFAKGGRMAEGHELIIREPFFDREVCDLINHLPNYQKAKGKQLDYLSCKAEKKYLLRAVAHQILPAEILTKPKGGFRLPLADWLRTTLSGIPANKLFSTDVQQQEYFNLTFVQRMLDEHQAKHRNWADLIFMLLVFDLWHRMYIESPLGNSCPVSSLIELWK